MSHWNRKLLIQLSDSIRSRLHQTTTPSAMKELLVPILEQADCGSKIVPANDHLLCDIRAQLCAACRSQQMCSCSDPGKWSPNCTLLQHNAD